MEHSISIVQALGISGALITILLSIIGVLLMQLFKRLAGDIRQLAEADAQHTKNHLALKDEVFRDSVRRTEFNSFASRIERGIETLSGQVQDGLQRVYDKIEQKADKE